MKEVIFKLPDDVLTLIIHKVENTPQEASLLEKWIYDGEERKTGKWINHKDEHQCSICGEVVIADVYDGEWGSNGIYEYCPNCGAKMEVEE